MGSCTSTNNFSHIASTSAKCTNNPTASEQQANYVAPTLSDFRGLRVD